MTRGFAKSVPNSLNAKLYLPVVFDVIDNHSFDQRTDRRPFCGINDLAVRGVGNRIHDYGDVRKIRNFHEHPERVRLFHDTAHSRTERKQPLSITPRLIAIHFPYLSLGY